MIIMTLFFTVIGSWKIVYSFSPEMKDNLNLDFLKTFEALRKQKQQLNKTALWLQAIYFVLSLSLTIIIQNISTKINRKQHIPKPLLIVEMTLTCVICVFETVIGVMTTMILRDTGLRVKWPFYMTVWVILVSYIVLELFQAFLYVNSTYYTIDSQFNQLEARLLAANFHYSLIFFAMFVIVWHTNRIKQHTLMMLKQ